MLINRNKRHIKFVILNNKEFVIFDNKIFTKTFLKKINIIYNNLKFENYFILFFKFDTFLFIVFVNKNNAIILIRKVCT